MGKLVEIIQQIEKDLEETDSEETKETGVEE